jgi:hypothetical protein
MEFYGRYQQETDKGPLVYRNYVSNTLLRFSDGGGIYSWQPAGYADLTGMLWKQNVSVNCLGDTSGWYEDAFWSYNFYLDQGSTQARLDSNVSVNAWGHSYFCAVASVGDTLTNNFSYNGAMKGGWSYHGIQVYGQPGHVITGNTLHTYYQAGEDAQGACLAWDSSGTSPGTMDYNIYVISEYNSALLWGSAGAWSIATVRTRTGQEANGVLYSYTFGQDTCFYNASLAQVSYTGLTGYTTLAGASLPSNTLTLEPMTAAILLKP